MGIKFDTWEFPEGTVLHNVSYYEKPECLEVVYKDPIIKRLEVSYRKPVIDIWITKPEFRSYKYQIPQEKMENCYSIKCKPSQVAKIIAEEIGGEWLKKYEENKDTMNSYDLKAMMCECPWVFKADFLPDVYFRLEWLKERGVDTDLNAVTFGLVDIETDVIERSLDIKNITEAPVPINAVTIILPEQKICAVLMLGPRPENRLHPKFHSLLKKQEVEYTWVYNHQEEFKKMIVEDDKDNKHYIADYDIRLHFFDFDKEIHLIKTVFDYINKYRPWFVMSWNAKFDHPYLMNRIKWLGYDPYDIIIPERFQTRQLYYKPDMSKRYAIKTSTDWFYTSTYSVYICQMRLYAQIRKSQKEQRSMSLTAIGNKVAKIRKLTETKSGTFRQFAYTDYIKFILYNVRDVVVQLAIESNVNDCKTLVSRSYMFATQYSKCFKEIHIVRNYREFDFETNSGFIQACRLIDDSGCDTAFKGAYVAPPEKNAPTGYLLYGKKINCIIYGALDADAKAYYPSTKRGMNLNGMSLLYKCRIPVETFIKGVSVNRSFNQEYYWYDNHKPPRQHEEDMSGPIINSYKNKNTASVMYNWLNLPSETEYFSMIDELLPVT